MNFVTYKELAPLRKLETKFSAIILSHSAGLIRTYHLRYAKRNVNDVLIK